MRDGMMNLISQALQRRSADVGLFDPKLDETYGTGDVVTVGTNALGDVCRTNPRQWNRSQSPSRSTELVHLPLRRSICWYMDELDNLYRAGLKFPQNGVEAWCRSMASGIPQTKL
jgi:hypothetical protein